MEPRAVNNRPSTKIVLLTSVILLAVLLVLLVGVKRSQDIRKKAAVEGGPAQILLTPGSTNVTAGSTFALTLSANTQNLPLDGIQVVIRFSGSIPENLAFTQTIPSGLKALRDASRQEGSDKIHELVYATLDPSAPPFTVNSIVPLGMYTMTAPTNGSLSITFDTNYSKILQNGVATDILQFPQDQTYAFVPGPTPTPTPIPQGFVGQYYANKNLAGTPKLTRTDPAINFDWGKSAPVPNLPADKFSVRWTKTEHFTTAGVYRFSMTTDDGGRVFVDGQRIINHWKNQSAKTKTADVTLSAGPHTIIMEYYENIGKAVAKLSWTKR